MTNVRATDFKNKLRSTVMSTWLLAFEELWKPIDGLLGTIPSIFLFSRLQLILRTAVSHYSNLSAHFLISSSAARLSLISYGIIPLFSSSSSPMLFFLLMTWQREQRQHFSSSSQLRFVGQACWDQKERERHLLPAGGWNLRISHVGGISGGKRNEKKHLAPRQRKENSEKGYGSSFCFIFYDRARIDSFYY